MDSTAGPRRKPGTIRRNITRHSQASAPAVPTPADIRRLAAVNPRRAADAIKRAAERLDPDLDPLEHVHAMLALEAAGDELRRLGEHEAARRGPGTHQPWDLDTVQAVTVAGPVCGQRRPSSRESHRTRPGHRRVRSTRAGPSDDEGPAGAPPAAPPWRRFIVDDHYLVVAVVG